MSFEACLSATVGNRASSAPCAGPRTAGLGLPSQLSRWRRRRAQQVVPRELLLWPKPGRTQFGSLIDGGACGLQSSLPRSCASLNGEPWHTANSRCCLHPRLPPDDHMKAFEGSMHCGAVGAGFVLGCEGALSSG